MMTDEQLGVRFDRLGALYMLCIRWHSRQASRGYRLLSKLSVWHYRPGHGLQNGMFESEQQRELFRHWRYLLRRGRLREPL